MSLVATITLGLDVGSHGVRAVIMDRRTLLAETSTDYAGPRPPVRRPLDCYIWAVTECLTALPVGALGRVEAVGVTGIRGSVIGFDRDQQPVGEVLPDVDDDCVGEAVTLRERYGDAITQRTGCPPFALSGLPKIVRHRDRADIWVSVQDAVAWWLTGTIACSAGSALRLGLLTRCGDRYDHVLLKELGLRGERLAPLVMIGQPVGSVSAAVVGRFGLAPVPVRAVPGDGPAALAAVQSDPEFRDRSVIMVNLGTSTVVSAPIADHPGLIIPSGCTLEMLAGGERSIETGDGTGMANVDWVACLLGVDTTELDRIASGAKDTDGVTLRLPAPDVWGGEHRGSLAGFDARFGRAELARAVLSGVADGATRAVKRIQSEVAADVVVLTGGGARSTVITEYLGHHISLPVRNYGDSELPAVGAALVAGESTL